MAGAVFDILGQSGGNPALSRERTLANLAAVFAVRNGDLGLRTTKTRIADPNMAQMMNGSLLGRALVSTVNFRTGKGMPMLTRPKTETPPPSANGALLGRKGTADETVAVIAFLASDGAASITGVDDLIDGGRTLGPRGV